MSRAGNCYDHAKVESFWATLKGELIGDHVFATRAEARSEIFWYIEVFYNRTRLHGALGYHSPVDFENSLSSTTTS
jgi:transposase InsO family protein